MSFIQVRDQHFQDQLQFLTTSLLSLQAYHSTPNMIQYLHDYNASIAIFLYKAQGYPLLKLISASDIIHNINSPYIADFLVHLSCQIVSLQYHYDHSNFAYGINFVFYQFFLLDFSDFLALQQSLQQMSRERQFSSIRQDKSIRKSKGISPQSHYNSTSGHKKNICVNCVNHTLSLSKLQRQNKQKDKNNSRYQQNMNDLDKKELWIKERRESKLSQELKKTLQYNLTQIKRIQNKKQEQKLIRQKTKEQIQTTLKKNEEQHMSAKKRSQLLKERWLSQLSNQIQIKQLNKKKQKIEKVKQIEKQHPFIKQSNPYHKIRLQEYKKQLKQQILQRQQKKRQQKYQKHYLSCQEFGEQDTMFQKIRSRCQKLKQLQKNKKTILLQQAKRNREQKQKQKQQIKTKKIIEDLQIKRQLNEAAERQRQKEILRKKKMTEYVNQIKQQINFVEQQKRLEKDKGKILYQNILIRQKLPQSIACQECTKIYPKTYITNI